MVVVMCAGDRIHIACTLYYYTDIYIAPLTHKPNRGAWIVQILESSQPL